MDVYCKDGKVIKVEGNNSLPMANGRVCLKGAALKQSLYHPDRLLYPMKRVGKRGEGKFERISWDEALTTIAEKLNETKEKYGAKSSLFYVGHPKWFRSQFTDLANQYGTPNFGTESSTCAYAPCVTACPLQVLEKDEQGFVIVAHQRRCIGCKRCAAVCPHDVPRFNKDMKIVKCDGCAVRVAHGLQPACVRACNTGALRLVE